MNDIKTESVSCTYCLNSEWFNGWKGLRGMCQVKVKQEDRFFVPFHPVLRQGDFCPYIKQTIKPIAVQKGGQLYERAADFENSAEVSVMW